MKSKKVKLETVYIIQHLLIKKVNKDNTVSETDLLNEFTFLNQIEANKMLNFLELNCSNKYLEYFQLVVKSNYINLFDYSIIKK